MNEHDLDLDSLREILLDAIDEYNNSSWIGDPDLLLERLASIFSAYSADFLDALGKAGRP